MVEKVTCKEKYVLNGDGPKVALLDLGAKRNIARSLNERGCEVTVYPALTSAKEILDADPDGIMLSNGPGDPKECTSIIRRNQKAVPVRCADFCDLSWTSADGAGKRCGYVQNEVRSSRRQSSGAVIWRPGRVYISSQNHGYVVDTDTLDPSVAVPAFENVNDGTNEGLAYTGKNIFTVQYPPGSMPGTAGFRVSV